jgi:predicted PolB exonuclease-like 3'-5' exonuclease
MYTMNVLVFDIETVPDLAAGRRYYEFSDLDDTQATQAMQNLRRQETGHEFLALHFHRIVAISVVYSNDEKLSVLSLGDLSSTEKELIETFYKALEKYSPVLVSWNGGNFDLPVLHYRSLIHGITAKRYWENGDTDPQFRYNNYLSRYHQRHTDLMDMLAAYQPRAYASLDSISTLLGLPGKMGMDGSKVAEYFQAGKLDEIRAYCETDVLNTYLVYLRFEHLRGHLTTVQYEARLAQVTQLLEQSDQPHFAEFLTHWQEGAAWHAKTYEQ